jgi:aminoglycoside/choline kinase family phosphotransferase
VAGDASNRRYFRATLGDTSYILVEAPPATEKNSAFLTVREILAGAGVKVPAVYGADLARGYLLLEDLGDRLLLAELDDASVTDWYAIAMGTLGRIARLDTAGLALPVYDAALLGEELGRFPQWFTGALLDCALGEDEQALLNRVFALLIDNALEQPRVLVHRDFHSRNLMPQPDGQLAVIDFQDAVLGPVSYDLVSLLRDCYIRWPEERVQDWALGYLRQLQGQGVATGVDAPRFLRWFDLMGLQRHIKVLGTFARLYLRDGKPSYLDDLPLVIRYVREVAARRAGEEPLLSAFHHWFEDRLTPLIAARLGRARS